MIRDLLQRLPGLLLALAPLAEAGAQYQAPSARVVWTTTPPVIDGVIDEAVWEGAALLGPLTQVTPRLGEAPSQRTEIRILTDQHNLYFGIRCFDDEPEKIIARDMRRDSWPFAEAQIDGDIDFLALQVLRHRCLVVIGNGLSVPRGGRSRTNSVL